MRSGERYAPITDSLEYHTGDGYWTEAHLQAYGEVLGDMSRDIALREILAPMLERCRQVFLAVRHKNDLYAKFMECDRKKLRTMIFYFTPDL
jgi:hypothetical protein